MSTGEGIVGVARGDLEAAADGRSEKLPTVTITEADGLRDRECSGGVQPSAWRSRDGRLWYPTIAGVAVVDPGQASLNPQMAAESIERVVADGQNLVPEDGLDLPAGTCRGPAFFSGSADAIGRLTFRASADIDFVRYRQCLHR